MRFCLLFLLSISHGMAYSQPAKTRNNFTLNGTITGKNLKVIWLRYKTYHGNDVQLSAPVRNGKFIFEGFIKSPAQAALADRYRKKSPFNGYFNEMFLSPGNMAVCLSENDLLSVKLTGSVMQDDWTELQKQKGPLMKAKMSLHDEMNEVTKATVSQKSRDAMALLSVKANRYDAQEKQLEYRFIQTHPNSYVSPFLMDYYLTMRTLPLDSAELFYNNLTTAVKSSVLGVSVHDVITYRRSSAPGSMAPVFATKDLNGKMLDLKSFRNKSYVLLEFWASFGSGPDEHNAYAKKLYQKYHIKGLEFVGISLDPIKKEWREAIQQDGTSSWHHIWCQESIQYLYDIKGMPPQVYILIDKSGKIIGRYKESTMLEKGNTADLDRKLAEILGR